MRTYDLAGVSYQIGPSSFYGGAISVRQVKFDCSRYMMPYRPNPDRYHYNSSAQALSTSNFGIAKDGSRATFLPTQPYIEGCLLVAKLGMLHHVNRDIDQRYNRLRVLAAHQKYQHCFIMFTV